MRATLTRRTFAALLAGAGAIAARPALAAPLLPPALPAPAPPTDAAPDLAPLGHRRAEPAEVRAEYDAYISGLPTGPAPFDVEEVVATAGEYLGDLGSVKSRELVGALVLAAWGHTQEYRWSDYERAIHVEADSLQMDRRAHEVVNDAVEFGARMGFALGRLRGGRSQAETAAWLTRAYQSAEPDAPVAGNPPPVVPTRSAGSVPVPIGATGRHGFAVIHVGDALAPRIAHGEVCVVDPEADLADPRFAFAAAMDTDGAVSVDWKDKPLADGWLRMGAVVSVIRPC